MLEEIYTQFTNSLQNNCQSLSDFVILSVQFWKFFCETGSRKSFRNLILGNMFKTEVSE